MLAKQADVNSKIANLLILIRRYRNSNEANEKEAARVAGILAGLIPEEEDLTGKILLNENKLAKDKIAIRELLEFIKKARNDISDKKGEEGRIEELVRVLTERLRIRSIERGSIQTRIKLKEEFISNLTHLARDEEPCNVEDIEKVNRLLIEFEDREEQLKKNISSKDEELELQRNRIGDLRLLLELAEKEERQLIKDKSDAELELFSLEVERNSSVVVLQKLKEKCAEDNQTLSIKNNIAQL